MTAGRKNIDNKKDWNTPPKYIKLIKKMLGEIELDPCSNKYSIVNAKTEFILPKDGLLEDWNYKTIYVNPPYGRDTERGTSIKSWIYKMNETYKKYNNEIICLIPVATNTSHYKDIIFKEGIGICFLNDTRLKFMINGELSKKGAPMSCAIIYWGKNYEKFEKIFSNYGKCFSIQINQEESIINT
jgi:hypothetical protein